jgi:hypothetical protein
MVNQLSQSARHRNGEFLMTTSVLLAVNGLWNPKIELSIRIKLIAFMHNAASFTTIEAVFGDFFASRSKPWPQVTPAQSA